VAETPDLLARLREFSYRYPDARERALVDVDFDVRPGELVVLAGRSGSGKTSLLRALAGLIPHYHGGDVAGEAQVAGFDLRFHGPAELGGAVGLVAQEPETQVVSTTVRAELELPLEMRDEPAPARARAVEEVALALAIPHLLDRTTGSLSGGELQRVALAAALVVRPRLVLLDEPTSQLDPVAGDELIWLLRRLNEEWGLAVVLAEHRLERCLAHADRVVALASGRVGFDGPPEPFLEWALAADPALATPAARLFSLAGLNPPPVGVKQAREALRAARVASDADRPGTPPIGTTPGRSAPRRAAWPWRRNRSAAPALAARDLWVALGDGGERRDALRGLDLELMPGERVALMGRNGAGKTTLLRTIAGSARPHRGRIELAGPAALVPQSPGDLMLRERVGDELPGAAGAAALAAAGLGDKAHSDPRDLSGGERQRLALAIVMAGRAGDGVPAVACLDEPTRGMDRGRKAELVAWLRELADAGAAVLVATHDVELAAELAERVILVADGRVIADGAAATILAGGWYFATEVARIVGDGAISPEAGADLIRMRRRAGDPTAAATITTGGGSR
jgi:energy-coupling factor transport system ATP-binding protein